MIGDIGKQLEMWPLIPFRVRTADGHEYPVPTHDHIHLPPGNGRIVISDDAGIVVVLPALLISGLLYAETA